MKLFYILLLMLVSCTGGTGRKISSKSTFSKTATIIIGDNKTIDSNSPLYPDYWITFLDNGNSGELWITDKSHSSMPLRDMLIIYEINNNPDAGKSADLSICWLKDGLRAVIYLNNHPQAVVNFKDKYGFCKSGLPPLQAGMNWSREGHKWDDKKYEQMMKFFKIDEK